MKIYIPTFRRGDNQITFNNLPDGVKENVILVVQEQEKNPGEDSNQNLNTDENTENIENKNNEISQKMNEDMKATSNENAKSVDQDNKIEKQGESK